MAFNQAVSESTSESTFQHRAIAVKSRGSVVKNIAELKVPYGVAVSDDGWVFISEWYGNCITILTRDGEKVKSFGSYGSGRGQFSAPTSMVITPKGTLLVVDMNNNRLQEFTMDGAECISCVGSKGEGPLQFHGPGGIAINKTTGQVYIADTCLDRVQVLNADLTFSHSIGGYGSGQGELDFPHDVAIDSQGFMYVADTDNNRIQRFTPEGHFISSFSIEGSEPGQLTQPHYLALDNDLLYISEGGANHRISVFTTVESLYIVSVVKY